MLSKYTAIFLVDSVFVYLVFSKRDRRWLATPWPYLAGVVALLVFTPVISWNWRHDWASFRFQGGRVNEAPGTSGRPGRFLLNQALAVLPLTLPLAVAAAMRMGRSARPEEQFLRACAWPIVLFFWGISWLRPTHVLWPLAGYLGLIVVMAGVAAEGAEKIGRFYGRVRNGLVALSCVALLGGGFHLVWFLPWITPIQGPYGWEEVAARARSARAGLPESAFYLALGRKYTVASELAYRLNRPFEVHGAHLVGENALQYRYWCDPEALRGREALIVIEGGARAGPALESLKRCFDAVEPAGEEVVVPIGRHPLIEEPPLRFQLWKGRGYHPPVTK